MTNKDVFCRRASASDAVEIHRLMLKAYEGLEDKSIFVCDGLEYIQSCICGGKGFGIVACNNNNRIVGSFVLYYPFMGEDNLGRDIDLPIEELPKVVHMESAVVMSEYRGRGLQYEMLKYAEELLDRSKYRYCLATVSPDNPASFRSLEKNGYRHITTKEKYNGLIRRIYLKEIY